MTALDFGNALPAGSDTPCNCEYDRHCLETETCVCGITVCECCTDTCLCPTGSWEAATWESPW